MPDARILDDIKTRYDLEIERRPDRLRRMRAGLCWLSAAASCLLAAVWLFADHRVFESRCVSDAHRMFEMECSACHDQSFAPLRRMAWFDNHQFSTSNEKCQSCHRETVADHVAPFDFAVGKVDAHRRTKLGEDLKGVFGQMGCAGCHQEHRGHDELSLVADTNCTACHADVKQRNLGVHYELGFADFAHHPEIAIWRSSDPNDPAARRALPVESAGKHPVDAAKFKFNHHRHLDPKLRAPNNTTETLSCANCHESDAGQAYFQPISFERHCHRCHQLGLPDTDSLPHVAPDVIQGILLDRLVRHAKQSGDLVLPTDDLGGPTKPPNQPEARDPKAEQKLAELAGPELERLQRRLFADAQPPEKLPVPAADGLLRAACSKCHETEPSQDSVGWKVLKPEIPVQWLTHGRFRHDRHASVDCLHCHSRDGTPATEAKRDAYYPALPDGLKDTTAIFASVSAKDVLMPKIETCRECHGSKQTALGRTSVRGDCAECHVYHHTPHSVPAKPELQELIRTGSFKAGKSP